MKNMTTKLVNKDIDPIAEAIKSKKFQQYSKDIMPRMRLAVEVYNSRDALGLSQQALAKEISSTQKVVSKVENGDMNLGIELLNRFVEKLNFNSDTLARVFNCGQSYIVIGTAGGKKGTENSVAHVVADEVFSPAVYPLGITGMIGSTTLHSDTTIIYSNIKHLNK
jgi:transcriptional regulator with XRE-family HTH domain